MMVDFTRSDCQYELGDNPWMVNYNLAVYRKLTKKTVLQIIEYHKRRYVINNLAKQESINSKLTALYRKVLTGFEVELQRLWGFPLDDRYHPHQRIGV